MARRLFPWLAFGLLFVGGCACGSVPEDAGPSPDGANAIDGGGGDLRDGGVGIDDAGGPFEPIREPSPTNPDNPWLDSDCDGLSDAEEYTSIWPGGAKTDPANWDSDGDGIADGVEAGRNQDIDDECPSTWRDADPATRTIPTVADTDGDCILDGVEDANRNGRVDDGESDPASVDSDGDGIPDGEEDANCNGALDPGETSPGDADSDGDGLNEGVERDVLGTDPASADSDGDGILDGLDDNPTTPDPDTDRDGISDERETQSGTHPNAADSDGDGLCDGPIDVPGTCVAGEDRNGNGRLDPGETGPLDPDTDCDAISDGEEASLGTHPRLADSDGDLIPDGVEVGKDAPVPGGCLEPDLDAQPSSTTDPLFIDTDGDGLLARSAARNRDGALGPANPGGAQETDPSDPDTDGDGLCDGPVTVGGTCIAGEDRNRNGRVDAGETDPRSADTDSDGDGLSNDLEAALGTDPNDDDSDDDGLSDGEEVLTYDTDPRGADTDCDGVSDQQEVALGTDPVLFDSDGDGISDGVELGKTAPVPSTDCGGTFVADANGQADTSPRSPDTDGDGVVDGAEDGNQNGRVDPGELDPTDPNDAGGAIGQACAQPITPELHSRQLLDVLLATAPQFASGNTSNIEMNGEGVGITVVDPGHGLVGFALRKTPEDASPSAELALLEARIGGLTLPLVQAFTTWDGFDAVRGTYDLAGTQPLATRAGHVVRRILDRPQNDATVLVPVAGAPNEAGPFKLGLEVVRRSPQTSIVVGVLTRLGAYNDVAQGRDFRLEDLVGGTALGQVGDATGQQCDVTESQVDQPVDIVWVLDNSGSMGDELDAVQAAADQMVAQLENSTLDWRVAVVSTEFNYRTSGPTFADAQRPTVGTCSFDGSTLGPPGSRVCLCKFVDGAGVQAFQDCVGAMKNLGGSGAEAGYGNLRDALAYLRGLPVGERLRPEARVIAVFITDAGEQTPQSLNSRTPYEGNVSSWTQFFQGGPGANTWDPTRNDEPPLIVGGILCPFAANCAGEEDSTGPEAPSGDSGNSLARDRYYQVLQNVGGIIGAIANPNGGTLQNLGDIATTIEGILNVVIGQVTPYELSHDPISSTIKVALEGPTEGSCNLADVPRSRIDGFSYDAATNRIAFFGACRPTQAGTDIAVSYRTWIDRTQDPDGGDQPCGGQCEPPWVCVNDQCLCPSDCGTGAALPPEQTCNAETCTPECLDDCGGTCGPGQVCDTVSCTCTCPEDCNGPQPGPGFLCDAATCQWSCAPDGCDPGMRPLGDNWICGPTCEWECPEDCGAGDLAPEERCNPTTCEVECAPDCNATCDGYTTCDAELCACVCVENATCAPGFVFDAESCTCVCDAEALFCPATHEADLESCSCRCGTDDQGKPNCKDACGAGEVCDPGQCKCVGIAG